jgi:GAF domain-containing protein
MSHAPSPLGPSLGASGTGPGGDVPVVRRAEERARKLTTLGALTQRIASARDSEAVCRAVAAATVTLLGARGVFVWLADPARGVLRLEGVVGDGSVLLERLTSVQELPLDAGVNGRVYGARTPAYVDDIQEDPDFLHPEFARALGLHALASIPLVTHGGAVGVLSALFGRRSAFTTEEKELIELLGDHAAIAVERAGCIRAWCAARPS